MRRGGNEYRSPSDHNCQGVGRERCRFHALCENKEMLPSSIFLRQKRPFGEMNELYNMWAHDPHGRGESAETGLAGWGSKSSLCWVDGSQMRGPVYCEPLYFEKRKFYILPDRCFHPSCLSSSLPLGVGLAGPGPTRWPVRRELYRPSFEEAELHKQVTGTPLTQCGLNKILVSAKKM